MEMYRENYIGSYICKERAQFGGGLKYMLISRSELNHTEMLVGTQI